MAATPSALAADIDQMVADLHAEYSGRPAHGGRLEQITGLAAALKNAVIQLEDEEAREADYEARLLSAHDTGMLTKDAQGQYIDFNHDARERLRHALRKREGAQA